MTHDAVLIEPDLFPEGDWARDFFTAYLSKKHYGDTTASRRAANVHGNAYNHRVETDPIFRALLAAADEEINDRLESISNSAAAFGITKTWFRHGTTETVTEIPLDHVRWLLERRLPEKYHLPTITQQNDPGQTAAFTFRMGEEPLKLNEAEAQDE